MASCPTTASHFAAAFRLVMTTDLTPFEKPNIEQNQDQETNPEAYPAGCKGTTAEIYTRQSTRGDDRETDGATER